MKRVSLEGLSLVEESVDNGFYGFGCFASDWAYGAICGWACLGGACVPW